MRIFSRTLTAVSLLLLPAIAHGTTIDVDTDASAIATYPFLTQSGGPFPWSDFGITASAAVLPGPLVATVSGTTGYNFDTSLTSGETFFAGSTTVDLGYSSSWGGLLAASTVGNVNSSFVYNIGPFSGSQTILNASPSVSLSGNLGAALQTSSIGLATNANSSPLGGLSGTLAAKAGLCPFCVTVASVTLGISVGAQIEQTAVWTPVVTYGDYVWYSTSATYSSSDTLTFVPGLLGNVENTFTTPPLSLSDGEAFYMNILPAVQLTMPITDSADLSVPASFDISGEIFGVGFGDSFPLGDL